TFDGSAELESVRASLPTEAFAAAWSRGQQMPLAAAVEYALAEPVDRPDGAAPAESATVPKLPAASGSGLPFPATVAAPAPHPLSPREREVAGLIAQGYTNKQIAAELIIAERTAMRHV